MNRAGLLRLEARRRKDRRNATKLFVTVASVTFAGGMLVTNPPTALLSRVRPTPANVAGAITCTSPSVTDGDTLRCGDVRIRLSSIDAPEMPGHCRPGRACTPGDPYASQANLARLVQGMEMACAQEDVDRYGRIVARCSVAGRDLSCAQVEGGFAVERYGELDC